MKWSHTVELIYRAYVLTTQDVSLQFTALRDTLTAKYGNRVSIDHEIPEERLPVREDDAMRHGAKGRLIVTYKDRPWLVLRQMKITIRAPDSEAAYGTIYEIMEDHPGTFAVMRILSEALTEMVAV